MKNICLLFLLLAIALFGYGQATKPSGSQRKEITALIDQYSMDRESRDTILLKKILTSWRLTARLKS
ncbi:MAG: hypothetical protein ABI416_00670 [Ginsengibacter sp.]